MSSRVSSDTTRTANPARIFDPKTLPREFQPEPLHLERQGEVQVSVVTADFAASPGLGAFLAPGQLKVAVLTFGHGKKRDALGEVRAIVYCPCELRFVQLATTRADLDWMSTFMSAPTEVEAFAREAWNLPADQTEPALCARIVSLDLKEATENFLRYVIDTARRVLSGMHGGQPCHLTVEANQGINSESFVPQAPKESLWLEAAVTQLGAVPAKQVTPDFFRSYQPSDPRASRAHIFLLPTPAASAS